MYFHRVKEGFDNSEHVSAWNHHIVGQSILNGSPFESFVVKNGIEEAVVERVKGKSYGLTERAVRNMHAAYVMETIIDELAKSAKHLAVIDLLKKKSGLSRTKPPITA